MSHRSVPLITIQATCNVICCQYNSMLQSNATVPLCMSDVIAYRAMPVCTENDAIVPLCMSDVTTYRVMPLCIENYATVRE